MENWILVVGYDRPHFESARADWLRLNVRLCSANTAEEAIEQCRRRKYLAVIAAYNVPNITPLIDFISETNQIPLVMLSQNDSGIKFAETIIRGTNTFIIDPDKLIESIKEIKKL
jgi:DNA-binding NarL/FixJ family response regulator